MSKPLAHDTRVYVGSSQNQGPMLVALKIRCRNIIYNQEVPTILGTTHMFPDIRGMVAQLNLASGVR